MINENCVQQYCCEDLSLIENYDDAINDTLQTWDCHHILGEQYSRQYLIDNNLYESRPASELRFVTHAEHNRLHLKGVPKPQLYKKILQFTKSGQFVREWASMTAIWQELGIAQSCICRCCQGNRKSAGGYVWRYALAEQQESQKSKNQ